MSDAKKRLTIHLPADIKEAIRLESFDREVPMSQIVEEALRERFLVIDNTGGGKK